MEKKENRGGARPGAGRPKRDEELEIINLLDKHIDRDVVVLKLLEKIKQGDGKMITLYLNYVYGKPTQTINQTTTLSVNDVDISELISFKKPDSENE
jgi:hypothetical protein